MLDIDKLAARLAAAAANLPAQADDEPTEQIETVEEPEEEKHAAPRASVGNVTVFNFFRHPDAHPLVLDLFLLKKYGPDFLLWEPETLEYRIPQDFKTTEVSDLNMAKIQACRTLHLVDTFWERWEVFTWVTAALNGFFPDFENLQVPTLAQAAISVYTAQKVRDDVEWSSEVKTFLAQVFKFEGVFYPLEPLNFVVVDDDGYVVNTSEVAEAWANYKRTKRMPPLGETILGEQMRRLLLIESAVEENRALLRDQLPLVGHA